MEQKPIIPYSRIVGDDGAIDKAKKDVAGLLEFILGEANKIKGALNNLDIKDSKGLAKYAKDIDKVKKAQVDAKKAFEDIVKIEELNNEVLKENNKITSENATGIDKLVIKLEEHKYALKAVNEMEKQGMITVEEATLARNDAKNMMASLSKEIKDQTKLEKAKQVIENGSIDTLEQVRERMAALRLVVQNTSITTEEGKKKVADYNNEINDLTDILGNNSDKFIQNKINVGNYTESIKEALKETSLFGVNVGEVSNNLNKSKEFFLGVKQSIINYYLALKAAGSAQTGLTLTQRASAVSSILFSTALKVLRVALISTGIGAIVVLLGSLISYFSGTQDGAEKLTQVLEPLKAIFNALVGVLDNLGRLLVSVFEDPKKAMFDLYNFLEKNIINRFTALGVILEGIINLDFGKVTDGALQAVTGVEGLTGKIKESAKATNKFLDDAIERGKQIASINAIIGRQQVKYARAELDISNLIEEQQLISKDASKPIAEREKAVREIIRLTTQLGGQEEEIIKNKIKALKLDQEGKGLANLTNEDKIKLIDLEKELDQAQDRGQDAYFENIRVIAKFKKEQHEREKERIKELLDLRIKTLQAELALFIANQGFKTKSFEEQIKIEQETKDKRLKIIEAEYETGKLLKIEYEAKKQEIENESGLKTIQLIEKINDYELDLQEKQSKRLTGETKLVNDNVLKLEIERLEAIKKARIDNANFLKLLGGKTERETNDLIEKANKDFNDAQLQAETDYNKNRIEQIKENAEIEKKIKINAVNSQINELLKIDPESQTIEQREKTLKAIEEFEKEKIKIETKYREISAKNRIAEIDKELTEVESGSLKSIELNREKEQLLTDIQKDKQDERLKALIEHNKKQEELEKKFKETMTLVVGEVFKALEKATNGQIEAQQKLIDKQKEAVDKQEERAKAGLENTLAFEQEIQAKREAELIKAQKRQQKLEKVKALWTSYQAYSSDPENKDGQALTKTLRDFAILEAIQASFGDGGLVADKVPTDANGITRGRSHKGNGGGIPVMVERGEGFFSAREVNNLGTENFRTFKNMLGKGKVSPNMFKNQRAEFMQALPIIIDNSNIEKGLEGVRQEIRNKPYQSLNVEELVSGFLKITETNKTPTKTTRNIHIVKRKKF